MSSRQNKKEISTDEEDRSISIHSSDTEEEIEDKTQSEHSDTQSEEENVQSEENTQSEEENIQSEEENTQSEEENESEDTQSEESSDVEQSENEYLSALKQIALYLDDEKVSNLLVLLSRKNKKKEYDVSNLLYKLSLTILPENEINNLKEFLKGL